MEERLVDGKKISLREWIYSYLLEKMDKGELLPGAAINLNEISQEMGVSKTPLRDALIQLEAEGYVTIWPRRGVVVNMLELEDIKYLYEVIGALESTMVRTNIDKFDDACLARMDELNVQMRAAIDNDDIFAYSKPHWDFHDVFLQISKNLFAKRVITPIKRRLWEFPRKNFFKEWELMACDEHQRIVEAIRRRDADEAARLIRDVHWGFDYNEKFIRRVYFGEIR